MVQTTPQQGSASTTTTPGKVPNDEPWTVLMTEELTPRELQRYLADLEKRTERIEARMETGFARLEGSMERLQFVDVKLYQAEQRAQDNRIADTVALIDALEKRVNARIDDTDTRQHWTLGLLIGALIAALAGGLVRLALG